jgi:hypothetical protein
MAVFIFELNSSLFLFSTVHVAHTNLLRITDAIGYNSTSINRHRDFRLEDESENCVDLKISRCIDIHTSTSSLLIIQHYMFRPNWPSSVYKLLD